MTNRYDVYLAENVDQIDFLNEKLALFASGAKTPRSGQIDRIVEEIAQLEKTLSTLRGTAKLTREMKGF